MNQELTVQSQDTGVAQYVAATDVLEAFARIKPSRITMNQFTTRNTEAVVGKFSLSDSPEQIDHITIIPLDIKISRVLYPPGDEFGVPPLCRSNDGVVPSPFAQFPQARSCGSCAQSKWSKEGGRSIKPPCGEVRTLIGIDMETSLPVSVPFKRSGIAPFQDFINYLQKDRIKVQAKREDGRKPEFFDYFFTIKANPVVDKKGKWVVPVFTDVKIVKNLGEYAHYHQQYVVEQAKYLDLKDVVEDEVDTAVNSALGQTTSGSVLDANFVEA